MGDFSVASAYLILGGHLYTPEIWVWKKIWKLQVPERVRFFIWQASHGKLITNQWRFKRGLGSPFCHHCSQEVETVVHVLRDCPLASFLWSHLVNPDYKMSLFCRFLGAMDRFKHEGQCFNWILS